MSANSRRLIHVDGTIMNAAEFPPASRSRRRTHQPAGCLLRRTSAVMIVSVISFSPYLVAAFASSARGSHKSSWAINFRNNFGRGRRTRTSFLTTSWRSPPAHGAGSSSKSSSSLSMIAKSGGKEILTTEQFAAEVLSPDLTDRPVLVFYSAPWCGPCRLSNPVVRDVMKEFDGRIDVVEVCTDDFAEIAAEAGVVSIPTIQLFYGGELIDTIVGCVAKNVLASAVTKILEETVEKNADGKDDEGRDGEEQ